MTTTFFKLSRRITHTHWNIEGEARVGAQGKFTTLFGEILTVLSPAITKPVNLKKCPRKHITKVATNRTSSVARHRNTPPLRSVASGIPNTVISTGS
ncbi:MAG: hypothetical protein P8M25_07895 [Paracoccaceae bacterium]|nr:hypothetical protein [Paracoccaceae bacterium]